jgi:sialic acid synthase SpsE
MLKKQININGRLIRHDKPPYIIAEAGSNFSQDLDIAKRLVEVAAQSGADAVKFQLFRADALYPNRDGLYETFKSIELHPDWVVVLNEYASECGIVFLASAFDPGSVDVLEDVGVSAHKIASSETTNLPLLHYIATKGKPILMSTGMCDMVDIHEAVNVCAAVGNDNIALMQCGAMYPLPSEYANLRTITTYKQVFGCPVGFSDHTLGYASAITAVGLGAAVFEKHFTLDRTMEGPDHFFALEPDELKHYVKSIQEGHQSLGASIKDMLPDERLHGRREGLYASRDLKPGEILTEGDLVTKRPAIGLRARYRSVVCGAELVASVGSDEPIFWKDLKFY